MDTIIQSEQDSYDLLLVLEMEMDRRVLVNENKQSSKDAHGFKSIKICTIFLKIFTF